MAHAQTSAERSSRTAETVAVLGAGRTMGFAVADTPAEAAASASIVLTMLSDADAVITISVPEQAA